MSARGRRREEGGDADGGWRMETGVILYFDLFSYPVASIFFGDMVIVSLFLLLFFKPIPDPVWKGKGLLAKCG